MMAKETAGLKIAVVRPFFTLAKGGAEYYAVELVKALIDYGHGVHVFAHQWDRPEEERVVYHRVAMVRKPAWLRVLSFHWNLRRCLVATDYDIVLGMTPFAPQVVYWLGDGLYRVWSGVMWPVKPVRWLMCARRAVMLVNLWLERRIMDGGAVHFVANSTLVKQQVVAHYNVPGERISVIHHGVDPRRFHPGVREQWRSIIRGSLGIADTEIVLLFAAHNFARKGLDITLVALSRISQQDNRVRLLVVGRGRISRFRRLAKVLGIAPRVTFIGSTNVIERYYAAADVFVLPTRYDPFAVVCLEAMACGLPVITTRMNGAAELIDEGQNGFSLDRRSVETQLTDRIRLLVDTGRYMEMGVHAAHRARALSVQHHVDAMVSLLGRVAAECSRNRSAIG